MGDISHTAYQHVILWFSGIIDEAARTDITRTLTRDWFHRCEHSLLKGDWRVSVSLTLVEPSVATPGPCEG